jgi:anti-sigma factor RsiW
MSECVNGELRDLLPELVNERLDPEMQRTVEAHVASCDECAKELELLRALRPALVREPVIDTQRIAAAVSAQTSSSRRRERSRVVTPRRLAIAAAALIAVSGIGYAIASRARVAPEVAVSRAPDSAARDTGKVIVAPAPTIASPRALPVVASAGVLDNLSDLSDDDLRTLTASLGGISTVLDANPAADIDPLGASLDDQSAGDR